MGGGGGGGVEKGREEGPPEEGLDHTSLGTCGFPEGPGGGGRGADTCSNTHIHVQQ